MPEATELTIIAEIPLGANLDRRALVGHDEDGDPIYGGPATVMDAVIMAAADILERDLLRKYGEANGGRYGGISYLYDEKLKARVEAIIDAKVAEHLAGLIAGKTVEDAIGERVAKWLNDATTTGYDKKPSRLEQALAKVIDREMQAAIDKTMADARRKALDAIAGVAQDKLAEALRQSISAVAK